MSNYTTKSVLKNATDADTWNVAKKADLASLKSSVDELDILKLKTTLVKKIKHDEFVKNVNAIQTTDTIDLVKIADYNTKTEEIEK